MNCPVCNVNLSMTFRENVEIDFCPKCRGVWLDRGEIDKIIEKVTGRHEAIDETSQPPPPAAPPSGHSPKKRGFLTEIFDWD